MIKLALKIKSYISIDVYITQAVILTATATQLLTVQQVGPLFSDTLLTVLSLAAL